MSKQVFQIDDMVVVNKGAYFGQTGEIIQFYQYSYRVKFEDGNSCWYQPHEIKHIEEAAVTVEDTHQIEAGDRFNEAISEFVGQAFEEVEGSSAREVAIFTADLIGLMFSHKLLTHE